MEFVLERVLPDDRLAHKCIFRLNVLDTSARLAYDVGAGESVQFVDGDGELVAVVIRNACKDRRIVEFVDHSIAGAIRTRRNARKEDRGHISQMGLSAGSRSNSKLGWVRNIERQKQNTSLHEQVDYDTSSSFAVLWSLARSLLPATIIEDFDKFIESLGPDIRMDGNGKMGVDASGKGAYHIKIKETDYEFHNSELAPPCGVVAENYCRYVHFENQPHKWAVSLTTSQSFDDSVSAVDAGGHFFISAYGIRIQAAPNTLIAWRPRDWHGTSLFHISPNPDSREQKFYQRGLCIVTGGRVVGCIKKWRAGKLSDQQLSEVGLDLEDKHPVGMEKEGNELDDLTKRLQAVPLRRSPRLVGKPKKSFVGC
ncbi:hypothetical protein AGABI2DRAFT_70749 [Agaricus bisporus var. bisporus H97]|uniref:hypothetical protein n=1 Tax=Agaricus bisporus var. bisporus (strain H97 / ATCC MYA-4626 / FGSC 10389) TaxID=936046 RepID=UPI00029F74A4|nr:hypothetical protein AGABI2DRAFT_70749 [Agaricus bisporus var. bisporus H97]EKV46278.1 hypothetical protein AGABI2DRAFT_70749 [Agaricus bisporus var. bisporus H97]